VNRSKSSRRLKIKQPLSEAERRAIYAEHEAAVKAEAEGQAKAREEKLEREADEYEAEKAAKLQAVEQAKVHPFTAMIPMMSDRELDALAVSITKDGQFKPIIYDADGVLVDGRCRLEACRRAGIEPRTVTLPPGADALHVSMSNNLSGKYLNTGQKAMSLAVLRPGASLSELVADSGLSKATMFEAIYVRDHMPSLVSQVMTPVITLREAYGITKQAVDIAKKETEALATLQRDAQDLAEAIRDERINLDQAMKEFQARVSKQKALRDAEKHLKDLRESA
jgi:ParB-like nuclease domain